MRTLASGTRGGFHPFLSYGVVGYVESVRMEPYTSDVPGSGPVAHPGFSYTTVDEPYATAIGGGVQARIGRHLALRAETHLITLLWQPLGARFSTSVSFPIGSYPPASDRGGR